MLVSTLSFGASSLGSVYLDIDEGINYIDVSPYYGLFKAEKVLGNALKEIQRDKIILSSKAGRYGEDSFDFSFERIRNSVDESLARLHTDYLDIIFLHGIEFGSYNQVIEEGIPALIHLKNKGKYVIMAYQHYLYPYLIRSFPMLKWTLFSHTVIIP